MRIDKWLWVARFYKTRSLARAAVEGGKVHLDDQRVKPAKAIALGQTLTITRGLYTTTVTVRGLAQQRRPATEAQGLYEESLESIEQRETLAAQRRMERAGLSLPSGRPNKKDRRDLRKLKTLDDTYRDAD
ncbi:MAG: S4 domain-containing protein [Pseudomonadota bacterium]